MKKLFLCIGLVVLLAGCGNNSKEDVLKKFSKTIDNCDSYLMKGTLEIYRNEDLYTYDVESSYLKDDKFRVSLTNKTNNHEQIILKNNEGVYVITPSLNKSFKFQSEWPYNNSQIYLLQPILIDLKNDKDLKFETKDSEYIFTAKVNYINDKNLIKQKVYIDKNMNLKKVEIFDDDDNVVMRLKVTKIEKNNNFDDNYFALEDNYDTDIDSEKNKQDSNIDQNKGTDSEEITEEKIEQDSNDTQVETNNTETTSNNDEVLYPMYVPIDTYLNTQDVMATDNGSRTIITFSGDSPFTFVQSSIDNKTMNYVYGDPYLIADTVGVVNDHSLSWISNDKEYYLTSDTVASSELLLIAESLSVTEVGK